MKSNRMPAAFVTDFGPFPAVEEDAYTAALGDMGRALPRPRAIVIMSGHWEARGDLAVTAGKKPGVEHDYYGFPDEFYQLDYPCPGDPALAAEIAERLAAAGFPTEADAQRPLDHGAWVPLSRIYPKADVPTVQLTVPAGDDGRKIFALGEALAPLRDEGVLLLGAGALSHNLRLIGGRGKTSPPEKWTLDFEAWLWERLGPGKREELFNYRTLAPGAALAAPTTDHFNPLFFVLGAASGGPSASAGVRGAASGEERRDLYREIRFGSGLMRIFLFGPDTFWEGAASKPVREIFKQGGRR